MRKRGKRTGQSRARLRASRFELVTGTLSGHHGTFILQHTGTMRNAAATVQVTVVPDSGTGDLVSLSGKMTLTIEGKQHSYDLEYARAPR